MNTTTKALRDAWMVGEGMYYILWSETPEVSEPNDAELHMASQALRERGLRLCNDDEGLLVTTINDVE